MTQEKRKPGRPPGSKNKNTKSQEQPADKHQKVKEMQEKRHADKRVIDEIWGVTLLAIGVFLIFATQLHTTGALGGAISNILKGLFGVMANLLPYYFIVCAFCLFFKKMQHINVRTSFFSILIFLLICVLNSYRFLTTGNKGLGFTALLTYYEQGISGGSGGAIGMELAVLLNKLIGPTGLIIACVAGLIVSILLVINTPISAGVEKFAEKHEAKKLVRELEHVESTTSAALPEEGYKYEEETTEKSGRFGFLNPFKGEDDYLVPARKVQETNFDDIDRQTTQALVEDTHSAKSVSQPKKNRKTFFDSFRDKRNKEQIVDYVANDENYGLGEGSDTTGLAKSGYRSSVGVASYGLDGVTSTPLGSYGLDGHIPGKASTNAIDSDMLDVATGLAASTTGAAVGAATSAAVSHSGNSAVTSAKKATAKKNPSSTSKSTTTDVPKAETKPSRPVIKTYQPEYVDDSTKSATSHIDDYADLAAAATALNTAKALSAEEGHEDKVDNRPKKQDHLEVINQISESNANIAEAKPYEFPSIDFLKKPKPSQSNMSDAQLEQKAALLEKTLADFHVEARVLAVTQGSSVTRYEVQPATGVKVSSITKLSDDIALNLRAKSIRIEAPIPGKAAVGIEVENEKPASVLVRELIDSDEFRKSKSKITFVVGKDISGRNIVADLKAMPHLLIAGATGSGKSVCINTIITSLLYKATPDEVRMILIDPKVVELGHYNGIPHMLIPVVTDPKKAAAALIWAVNEMTRRYKLFAENGVKEIESYNELMVADGKPEEKMPQVVIIIDELADLMMASPSQVEESICRLAQLARAAGMHLIVATQRPSVDIVTGLIKANIPSRIAFSVSSQFDSRTILDVGGAEKLLGKGDMLFSPVGKKPFRVQGPFISDGETAKIIDFVKNQGEANYDDNVSKAVESPEAASGGGNASDELTEDAIAFILKSQKASVSMLQRRFRIGYNRAARIIDEIEERGIISPQDGSSPRQVLITEQDYYDAKDVSDTDE